MGATAGSLSYMLGDEFQSTRPRWARPMRRAAHAKSSPFQSTRPRWARQYLPCKERRIMVISIHAPAMGATMRCSLCSHLMPFQSTRPRWARPAAPPPKIDQAPFQSTRPRWARLRLMFASDDAATFQSTRPRWARLKCRILGAEVVDISIHAPAMGATHQRRPPV